MIIATYTLGGDSASSTEYSNSQSNGAVVAIACVITFIVTLTATIIITFIVIFVFIKKKFADIAKDMIATTDEQTTATAEKDTVIYDTVGPPSVTNNKGEYELQNPGYDTSNKVGMVTNPAYETCK